MPPPMPLSIGVNWRRGCFFHAGNKTSFGTDLHLLGSRLILLINGWFGGVGEGMAGRSSSSTLRGAMNMMASSGPRHTKVRDHSGQAASSLMLNLPKNQEATPGSPLREYLAQCRLALTLLGVLATRPCLTLLFSLGLLFGLLFGLGFGFHNLDAHHRRGLQRDATQQA